MGVLVTRPNEQGQQLCELLAENGIPAIHQPLISIVPGQDLNNLSTHIHSYDIIIAVSQHAIPFVDQALKSDHAKWPTQACYFAVGQKTAHILSAKTKQNVHYPRICDSEHLLALPQLSRIKNKQILILRGNGGRELIFNTLEEKQANVSYCEAYQRKNIAFRSDLLMPIWQDKEIDTIIVTSSGQLAYLFQQFNSNNKAWLLNLRLLVPSERIAQDAKQLGFCSVINTGSANNQVLLAALLPQ